MLNAASSGQYINSAEDLDHCVYKLQCSPLFEQHAEYIRRQFIYSLLQVGRTGLKHGLNAYKLVQEDEPETLHIITTFILLDARANDHGFQILNEEGGFSRLVELIANPREHEEGLHRLLMELLYEMSRIQRISVENLCA